MVHMVTTNKYIVNDVSPIVIVFLNHNLNLTWKDEIKLKTHVLWQHNIYITE